MNTAAKLQSLAIERPFVARYKLRPDGEFICSVAVLVITCLVICHSAKIVRELFWLPVWIDRCVLDWVFHLPSSPICSAQKHILSLWHNVHNFVLFFLFPCRTNHSIYAFVAWLTMTILYTPLGYPTKSDTNVAVVTANVALSAPCRIFNGHWFEFMIYAMLHWIDMCTKCGQTFCALSLCVQAGGIN